MSRDEEYIEELEEETSGLKARLCRAQGERERLRAEVADLRDRLDRSAQEVVRRGGAIAAIRRALDRLIAGQPPPEHCTEYAMGINHAIGAIDAALAGGQEQG